MRFLSNALQSSAKHSIRLWNFEEEHHITSPSEAGVNDIKRHITFSTNSMWYPPKSSSSCASSSKAQKPLNHLTHCNELFWCFHLEMCLSALWNRDLKYSATLLGQDGKNVFVGFCMVKSYSTFQTGGNFCLDECVWLVAELLWCCWASCSYIRLYPGFGTISRFLHDEKSCRIYWLAVKMRHWLRRAVTSPPLFTLLGVQNYGIILLRLLVYSCRMSWFGR